MTIAAAISATADSSTAVTTAAGTISDGSHGTLRNRSATASAIRSAGVRASGNSGDGPASFSWGTIPSLPNQPRSRTIQLPDPQPNRSPPSFDPRLAGQCTEIPDAGTGAPERDPKTPENPLSGGQKGCFSRYVSSFKLDSIDLRVRAIADEREQRTVV